MTKLCLNGIVKNEAANLPRMLESVAPFISSYEMVDTGSTDDTVKIINDFMDARGIPGFVEHAPFINFSQARNAALAGARRHQKTLEWDYLLLVDADMELIVEDPRAFENLTDTAYTMLQVNGPIVYPNVRLLRHDNPSLYFGVTHEYLSTVTRPQPLTGAKFKDHACGSNRPDKFKRDIKLLRDDLMKDPLNPRSWFYLAQSYKDAGKYNDAIKAYTRRIKIGGWDEEIWHSKLEIARCYRALNNENCFVNGALEAYEARPHRVEPLYDLAHYHRLRGENATAYMFAAAGAELPYPKDEMLFVESYPYRGGLLEEISITGFYNPRTRQHGFEATNELSLSREVPDAMKALARQNMYHYLEPLSKHAPSFGAERLDAGLPILGSWNCLNPSITAHNGALVANVRTVNYSIREDGSYDMQGDSAIRTRNFLVWLNPYLERYSHQEITPSGGFPKPTYPHVLGFEDIRLLSHNGNIWVNACLREQNPEGWCEQFYGCIGEDGVIQGATKISPPWKAHEKNWMPFSTAQGIQYMYRPGLSLNVDGDVTRQRKYPVDVDHLSGSSQLIRFDYGGCERTGYLGIVHEAMAEPGTGKRCYSHRFIRYSHDFEQVKVSHPFVFLDRGIEFAAGITVYKDDVIVSFGVKDREAWLGRLSVQDVRNML